ncbi:MAG TPA: lysylphosphatidylglycerol synthase domain-containing protein [Puia sp.]|nr:lysylphosphatidylglycerol synthase domain-containing protein [Puia sp.]
MLLTGFIYRQVIHQPGWRSSLQQIGMAIRGPQQWKLWLVLALMPLNWGLEARKWQLALRPLGGIAYRNAFRAVFTGSTMACFTPNRMGEYLGRILYVKEGNRIKAISLTMACSIAQLMVTLLIGLLGILYLRADLHPASTGRHHWQFALTVLFWTVLVLLISLTFIYCRLSLVASFLLKIPFLHRFSAYIKVLENFDAALLLKILFLSFGRYIVFIVQYSLVFPVFGVALGFWRVWGGMSVVFLVMAVVPTLTFLTELGLRWEASIQVLEFYSSNVVGIFATSFAIWLINLIIPALIGSLLIVRIKLFKSR